MRKVGAFVIVFVLSFLASQLLMGRSSKVLVCHMPPGHPENAHVISVSENAVPAHLAHGDCVVVSASECPCSSPSRFRSADH